MQAIGNYINGEIVAPLSGKFLDNIDPAVGMVYSKAPDSDQRDVDAAVKAAEAAFPIWSHTSADERSRIMLKIADLIEANLEHFATAESVDNGKPLKLARTVDIPRAAKSFRFFGTAILHARSEVHGADLAERRGGGAARRPAVHFDLVPPRAGDAAVPDRVRQPQRAVAVHAILDPAIDRRDAVRRSKLLGAGGVGEGRDGKIEGVQGRLQQRNGGGVTAETRARGRGGGEV